MSTETGWLAVTVEAQQRMSMGRGAGRAFHTDTHQHVPGAVLRGAIARSWLVDGAALDTTFRDVFDRYLRFGPLFAEGTDLRPLSVRHCKYEHNPAHRCHPHRPGPAPVAVTSSPHSYWDAAFDAPAEHPLPPGWDRPDGHWVPSKGDLVTAAGVVMPTTTVTSTAIDHRRGTASDGQLFSRAAVETGTVLRGFVVGRRDILDVLAKSLTEQDRLELGGRTSVLGSARISATPIHAPSLIERHHHPVDGDRTMGGEPIASGQLVLRTQSPTFLLDPAGRASFDVEAELRRLGFAGVVERIWHRPVTEGTGGFHAASRLPKPADIGLAAGTTALLTPTQDDAAVLASITERGLGVRRPEGFGWVALADTPWHHPTANSTADSAATGTTTPDDGTGFAALWHSTRAAQLNAAQLTWLAQRLVDTTGDPSATESALQQPAAGELTTTQRTFVRDALSRPGDVRRRLADQIRARRSQ